MAEFFDLIVDKKENIFVGGFATKIIARPVMI
jgi:hypothetical protein